MRLPTVIGIALALALATSAFAMRNGTAVDDPATTGMVHFLLEFDTARIEDHNACSGTLVAPSWVLTARHCVVPAANWFGARGERPYRTSEVGTGHGAVWEPTARRFVIAGSAPDPVTAIDRPALWSYDASDVILPAPFGDDGAGSITRLGGAGAAGFTAIVRTTSGDLVAAGTVEVGGSSYQLVARFDRDGHLRQAPLPALDRPAAGIGYDPLRAGQVRALAALPDGGVVTVGVRTEGGVSRWTATRYDAAGHARPGYGYLDGAGVVGELIDVAVVGDPALRSYVVALGTRVVGGAGVGQPVLVVLTDDGPPGPIVPLVDWDPARGVPRALAGDGADRVVVVGDGRDGDRILATRHLVPSLARDGTFGADGTAELAIDSTAFSITSAGVTVDPQHRVLVGVNAGYDNGYATANLARFTAAGRPDPSFGQTGYVLWNGRSSLRALDLAVAPEAPIAGSEPPWSGVALIVGHYDGAADSPTRPAAMAISTLHHDRLPAAFQARLADSTPVDLDRVVFFPDATVDAALVKLKTPLTGPIRFAGVAAAEALTWGQPLVCYGFGLNNEDVSGQLRRGVFAFDTLERDLVDIASVCDDSQCGAFFKGGDSGGACFLADGPGQSWQLVSVTSTADAIAARNRWSVYPNSPSQTGVRADRLGPWITATLAAP